MLILTFIINNKIIYLILINFLNNLTFLAQFDEKTFFTTDYHRRF